MLVGVAVLVVADSPANAVLPPLNSQPNGLNVFEMNNMLSNK